MTPNLPHVATATGLTLALLLSNNFVHGADATHNCTAPYNGKRVSISLNVTRHRVDLRPDYWCDEDGCEAYNYNLQIFTSKQNVFCGGSVPWPEPICSVKSNSPWVYTPLYSSSVRSIQGRLAANKASAEVVNMVLRARAMVYGEPLVGETTGVDGGEQAIMGWATDAQNAEERDKWRNPRPGTVTMTIPNINQPSSIFSGESGDDLTKSVYYYTIDGYTCSQK